VIRKRLVTYADHVRKFVAGHGAGASRAITLAKLLLWFVLIVGAIITRYPAFFGASNA